MPKIKLDDLSMYYEIHGTGEPIVFIAGFSVDHTNWIEIIAHFKENYQLILFDNRGAGQTDVPEGPYSIEQMADDVAGLCAHLGIPQAHFVGSSMGGFILQTLAYKNPHLIKSAVICNSTYNIKNCFTIYLSAEHDLLKANAPLASLVKASCSWVFSIHYLSQPGMLNKLIQLNLINPHPFTLKGYEGQYSALNGFNAENWADQIKVPVLVLAGDEDLIFNKTSVVALANKIPNAQFHCFKQCGHLPQMEYPEEFAELVKGFIGKIKES